VPPAATPLDALDQLLEYEYGPAFHRLDVLALLDQPDRLQRLLEPFTRLVSW
jgi:hypothetical protein